jgi:hypothetical protein
MGRPIFSFALGPPDEGSNFALPPSSAAYQYKRADKTSRFDHPNTPKSYKTPGNHGNVAGE